PPQPGAAALSAPGPTGVDVDAANLPVRQQCFLVLWRPGTGSRVSRMGSPPRFALAETPHGHHPQSAAWGATHGQGQRGHGLLLTRAALSARMSRAVNKRRDRVRGPA